MQIRRLTSGEYEVHEASYLQRTVLVRSYQLGILVLRYLQRLNSEQAFVCQSQLVPTTASLPISNLIQTSNYLAVLHTTWPSVNYRSNYKHLNFFTKTMYFLILFVYIVCAKSCNCWVVKALDCHSKNVGQTYVIGGIWKSYRPNSSYAPVKFYFTGRHSQPLTV